MQHENTDVPFRFGESGWIWRLGKRIMRRLGSCHPRTHLRVSVTVCLEKRAQRGTMTAVTACEKLTRRGWVVWSLDLSRGKYELLGEVEGRQILFQFGRENFLTTRPFQQGMAFLLHKIAGARESMGSFYCLGQRSTEDLLLNIEEFELTLAWFIEHGAMLVFDPCGYRCDRDRRIHIHELHWQDPLGASLSKKRDLSILYCDIHNTSHRHGA